MSAGAGTVHYFITNEGHRYLDEYVRPETDDFYVESMQQLLVVVSASTDGMTYQDLMHDFSLPFDLRTDRHQETRRLFDWMVGNMISIIGDAMEMGYFQTQIKWRRDE